MLPLKSPELKKNLKNIKLINLPICDQNGEVLSENSWPKFHGIFNGRVVIINESDEILRLSNLGSFGQRGSFDKGIITDYRTLQNQVLKQKPKYETMTLVPFEFPENNEDKDVGNDDANCQSFGESSMSYKDTVYIQKIKSLRRKNDNMSEKDIHIHHHESIIHDNDVDDGAPANWKDLKKNFPDEFNQLLILSGHEHCMPYFLLLEEAVFLFYTLECLEIREENGSVISVPECWKQFNSLKRDFIFFYAAYHYYRSKGWTVKSGQQYGGDYVLYRSSPDYCHSSYVVVVNVNSQNSKLLSSWPSWFACSRVVECASKELIVCTVHGPVYEEGMPVDLTKYTVNDTLVRRFIPSQHRMQF